MRTNKLHAHTSYEFRCACIPKPICISMVHISCMHLKYNMQNSKTCWVWSEAGKPTSNGMNILWLATYAHSVIDRSRYTHHNNWSQSLIKYHYCISQLYAKEYGFCICEREVLNPYSSSTWPIVFNMIRNIVLDKYMLSHSYNSRR